MIKFAPRFWNYACPLSVQKWILNVIEFFLKGKFPDSLKYYTVKHLHRKGFPPQCHHMSSQTLWSPSGLWLKCNQFLRLGRPVGAVTLSRWEWWWNERWIWGARGALNLISTNYPDHSHHGRLPLSRKNAHVRAGNRTRDLMVSSQELWPPSHGADRIEKVINKKFQITHQSHCQRPSPK